MNTREPCQPSTTNPSSTDGPEAYGISSFDSNAMKSDNPHSGFYRADTARTLDLNGGNPACNQGGGTGSSPDRGDRLPQRNRKPFCERHSASERAGNEPQQQQRSQSADEVMRGGSTFLTLPTPLKQKQTATTERTAKHTSALPIEPSRTRASAGGTVGTLQKRSEPHAEGTAQRLTSSAPPRKR